MAKPPNSSTWHGALAPKALDTDGFALDERDPAALISLLAEVSRAVGFDDGTEIRTGGYDALWHDNIAFLLAEMCQVDARAEYRANRQSGAGDLIAVLTGTLARIQRWQRRARDLPGALGGRGIEAALYATIEQAIQRELSPAFATPDQEQASFDSLSQAKMWEDRPAESLSFAYSTANRTTLRLVSVARDYLDRALHEKSDHAPHVGLILGVLKTFQSVQGDLAHLTERHLLYHYKTALQLAPRAAVPDRAVVCFDLAPDAQVATVPKGQTFLAPAKDGVPAATYHALETCDLAPGRLVQQVAVRLPRRSSTESAGLALTPLGLQAAYVGAAAPWAPFGPAQMPDVPLGVSIADPVLRMASGTRHLRVTFHFNPDAPVTVATAIRRFTRAAIRDLGAAPGPARMARLWRAALSVDLGGQKVPITELTAQGDRVTLTCVVPADAPPVEDPVLTCRLVPQARIFAGGAVADLKLLRVDLDLTVDKAVPHRAMVNGAPVPVEAPFAPFGPAPRPPAEVSVTLPELAAKQVQEITLHMPWSGVPTTREDWDKTYAPYPDIAVEDIVLEGFATGDPAKATLQPMFPIRDDGTLVRSPQFTVRGTGLSRGLTLRLAAPKDGFGQAAYPTVVAQAATPPSRWFAALRGAPPPPEIPPPPPVPMVHNMRLSYLAKASVQPGAALRRLDGLAVPPLTPAGPALTLELPDVDAALYLEFEDLVPGRRLSLFVDIEASQAPQWQKDSGYRFPALSWWYFNGKDLSPLPDDALRHDGTRELVRPGVIDILLPQDLGGPKTWLVAMITGDPDRYGKITAITPRAVMVERVMTEARADPDPLTPKPANPTSPTEPTEPTVHPGPDPLDAVPFLPAGRIKALTAPITGIKGLHQPRKSFGGRPAETEPDFRARVSGRLNHRARAIRPRDFERLTLDAFPNIGEAKAIPTAPGELVLVVLPKRYGPVTEAPPAVSMIDRYDIWSYLTDHASAQVQKLTVRGPLYETVSIRGRLDMERSAGASALGNIERLLAQRVAPWLFDPMVPVRIGTGRITLTDVHAFIEDLPDVKAAHAVQVLHSFVLKRPGGRRHHGFKDSARVAGRGALITCGTPWSVLVPERPLGLKTLPERTGIGTLTLGSDLYSYPDTDAALRTMRPLPAGIGQLRIGASFIPTEPFDATPPFERLL